MLQLECLRQGCKPDMLQAEQACIGIHMMQDSGVELAARITQSSSLSWEQCTLSVDSLELSGQVSVCYSPCCSVCLVPVYRQVLPEIHTWFLTLLASRANLRVLTVSGQLAAAGEMLAIMTVLEFPPKESCTQRRVDICIRSASHWFAACCEQAVL